MPLDVVVRVGTMNKLLRFEHCCWSRRFAAGFGLFALLLGATCSWGAAVPTPGGAKPAPVVSIDLVYQEVPYSFVNWGATVVSQSTPFKKEPAFGSHKVIRGELQLGSETNNAVNFAWDRTGGKLYLDLNRNRDLSDDPAGVFATQRGYTDNYQTFTNVHLTFASPAGPRRMLADLNFYDYSRNLSCSVAMRSLWEGKLTLQGTEWQVGLVENPFDRSTAGAGRQLLLRPWTERSQSFSTYDGAARAVPFSRKVFLNQQAYDFDLVPASQGDAATYRLTLTEQFPALGELQVAGQFIQRLLLEGGPYLVILDQPPATVRIPVGSYGEPKVQLKKGDTLAYLQERYSPAGKRLTVGDKQPAVLKVGGPLTNSVTVTRRGASLYLVYQLKGADDRLYTLNTPAREHPPEFVVSQGGKKIGSGKFEFG